VKIKIADLVRPDLVDLKPYEVKDVPRRVNGVFIEGAYVYRAK
jgi:hypothetical protein